MLYGSGPGACPGRPAVRSAEEYGCRLAPLSLIAARSSRHARGFAGSGGGVTLRQPNQRSLAGLGLARRARRKRQPRPPAAESRARLAACQPMCPWARLAPTGKAQARARRWSPSYPLTTSAASNSGTARGCSAGGPTRRRRTARWTRYGRPMTVARARTCEELTTAPDTAEKLPGLANFWKAQIRRSFQPQRSDCRLRPEARLTICRRRLQIADPEKSNCLPADGSLRSALSNGSVSL